MSLRTIHTHHHSGALELNSQAVLLATGVASPLMPGVAPSRSGTITGLVDASVTLGHHYKHHLTITSTGSINPATAGDTGLIDPATIALAHVTNMGVIRGGSSSDAATQGGIGIDFAGSAAHLRNSGTISGGSSTTTQAGGDGVYITGAGAIIQNTGTISGGSSAGQGGAGVDLTASGTITNRGTISGGAGGGNTLWGAGVELGADTARLVNYGTVYGSVGVEISAAGATLENRGAITSVKYDGVGIDLTQAAMVRNSSGASVTGGAVGVEIGSAGGTLINAGTITCHLAQAGGGTAVHAAAYVDITNSGMIIGGEAGYNYLGNRGYNGGTGVFLEQGGMLHNGGTIMGGTGVSTEDYGVAGGAGVIFGTAGTLFNSGLIEGATAIGGLYGGDYGNVGVEFQAGGTLTNSGTIIGASSFGDVDTGLGPFGADAVRLLAGGTIYNTGLIIGGNGGYGYSRGGGGGVGVDLARGGILTNTGHIQGGNNAYGGNDYYEGGVGVFINGGTVATSGLIAGGSKFGGDTAYSVLFGRLAGTLVVEQGASFSGAVLGNGTNDTLELGTAKSGTFTGLGTQVTGFQTIEEASGANWTLADGSSIASTTALSTDGTLSTVGAVEDHGAATNNGTIICSSGTLAFLGALGNDGRLNISAGNLSSAQMVTGTGAIDISAAGTLHLLDGAGAGQTIDFLAAGGLADIVNPLNFLGDFVGFGAGATIDLSQSSGLTETSYNFANGTLTIMDHSSIEAALRFTGNYTTADFAVKSDGDNGLFVTFK